MDYVVERITGRFRNIDDGTLAAIRDAMAGVLESLGAEGLKGMGISAGAPLPLWAEVEFLDNIIRFELEERPRGQVN